MASRATNSRGVDMGNKRIANWLQRIYLTRDEEISCSQCFDLVSGYVEMEITGLDPASKLPQVQHHLDQCLACREEYETLRDLRHLEDDQGTPSLDDLRKLFL
jgi:hypothetical protein